MARGSLSPENVIQNELRVLRCSHRNFCSIAGFPYGTFAMVMAGTKDFDSSQVEGLREKLEQMKALEQSVGLPLDWSQSEEIANALALRLVQRILQDEHEPSEKWDQLAQQATERLR